MDLHFTGLYACALAVVYIALQYNVILQRGASKISINYGDDMQLARKNSADMEILSKQYHWPSILMAAT